MADEKPTGTEERAKYTQAEINALGEKGAAFKNPDGSYSYPIDDLEDLRNAIHAVGRGGADHDAIRKYVIGRAGALNASDEIPDNWNSDGSLKDADEKNHDAGRTGRRRSVSDEMRGARDDMRGVREIRRMPVVGFEMREVPNGHGGTDLLCSGYASTTCADQDDTSNAYEMEDWLGPWQESIVRGAFVKTLKENADVAFLVNHGGVTMARTKPGTLKLGEDLTGLHYEAKLNPTRPDVQILQAAVQDGAVDESSFAFRVTRQEWNADYDRRWITEVNLDKGDVSPVNYGANPHTGGLVSMRSAMTVLNARGITWRAFGDALREVRAGKSLSQATLDVLQPILDDLAAIDKMVDADQPKLAALLGVENPDADDQEQEQHAAGDSGGEAAWVPPVILPDYTTAARAALAAARRR